MKFYVYVDFTTEALPRPFYVGKGNASRVSNLHRNRYHSSISLKYGIKREIVLETLDEQEAFDLERKLIIEHNTFIGNESAWGANFTRGGEGTSGMKHTDKSKRKNSESNRLACSGEKNGMFGKHHSEETRQKIANNQRGWKHTDDAKKAISQASSLRQFGRKLSEATKQKIALARRGQIPWNKGLKNG